MKKYKESKVIYWSRNQWRDCLTYGSKYLVFDAFSYQQTDIMAHGIDYSEYRLTILNFQHVWRVQKRG